MVAIHLPSDVLLKNPTKCAASFTEQTNEGKHYRKVHKEKKEAEEEDGTSDEE